MSEMHMLVTFPGSGLLQVRPPPRAADQWLETHSLRLEKGEAVEQ